MDDATQMILATLDPYRNPKHGKNRYNTPWRSDSDGGTLAVDQDSAYGLGLKWFDHKDGTAGNGWTLAKLLNIKVGGKTIAKEAPCQGLADYAHSHGVDVSVFAAAGWIEVQRSNHLAFRFPTTTGYRYRYADPGKAGRKYDSESGYHNCWYGLERAVELTGSGPLIICNGEPSTVAAQYHNVPACCVTGGEKGSMSQELIEQLQSVWTGAILIAYDCDTTGRKASKALAQQLRDAGLTVRAIDLQGSDGYDVADFCRLHNGTSATAILDLPPLIEVEQAVVTDRPALPRTDWRTTGITLAQLQHKEFIPERWIIEDLLPEGACLLAAKYKNKKSWMALALSLAIAMNGRALGRYRVDPGRVLYLDLEGKQQRIQKRTRAILGVQQVAWPENFHVYTKWPRGEEGYRELEYWYKQYPDTALSVVDVLASLRRPMDKNEMIYEYDRDTVDPLNQLFERYKSAGLLIHHFNKAKNDDIMDSITGSTGLPSAVNSMWALTKDVNNSEMQVLHLRGRDYENEDPISLRWDNYLTMHVVEGKAIEISISAERKKILACFEDDEAMAIKDIAAQCGMSVPAAHKLLSKMINDGLIDKVGYGRYARIVRQGG
jgi:AAA domain/Winged helix-turn-helix DNA-binding/Toprim-like